MKTKPSFDPLPMYEPPHTVQYEKERSENGMQFKWSPEAYRAYACAALNGIFNLPEFKELLNEMAHPDCDHDRYVAIVRHITNFVCDIAGKMEFQERCERAEWRD